MTQCGGHTPPLLKWVVVGGCQSRETKTGAPARSAAAAQAVNTGMTASPSATGSEPPGQKSFCGSTSNSAVAYLKGRKSWHSHLS